jgi:hypothetical protein
MRNKWKYRDARGAMSAQLRVSKNRGSLEIGGVYDKERCVLGRKKDIGAKGSKRLRKRKMRVAIVMLCLSTV